MEMRTQVWRPNTHKVSASHRVWRSRELGLGTASTGFSRRSTVQGQQDLQRLKDPATPVSFFPAQTKLVGLLMPLWIECPPADMAKQLRLMFLLPKRSMKTADKPFLPPKHLLQQPEESPTPGPTHQP